MTEEEFRSSELRNQRTGLDYSAMEAAYKLYHRNGGNFLDLAPNGKTSILFQTLLSEFGGDRVAAIKAKSAVYSDRFRKWFGDWEKYAPKSDFSKVEEQLVEENRASKTAYKIFNRGYYALYSPEEILKNIKTLFPDADFDSDYDYTTLSKFILDNIQNINSDIKIKLGRLDENVLGTYNISSHIITINESYYNEKPDVQSVVNTILHELVHAYTDEFLYNKSNENILNDLISLKLYIEDCSLGTEYEDEYAFKNVDEFVAEFFTNEDFQNFLMTLQPIDKKQYKNLFYQICDFILSLFTSQHTLYDQIRPAMYNILKVGAENNVTKDNSVSKVVDENGEPLVVYHHTDDENLVKFEKEFNNYFSSVKNGTKHAIFFTTTKQSILNRKHKIPVFLNLKTPFTYNGTKESMHQSGTDYTTLVNKSEEVGGAIFTGLDDNKLENQTVLVAYAPNQIKSATGNIEIEQPGTGFSTTNDEINKLEPKSTAFLNAENLVKSASFENILDPQISAKLLDGEFVSSQDIIQSMLNNGAFDKHTEDLASILQKHNISIKVDNSLGVGTLAETITGKNGKSVVLLNGNLLKNVSKKYAGITILHEIIHAVTVNAINNPQTKEEKAFVKANKKVLSTLRNAFKGREYLLNNSEYGAYALTNEKEFAATFITDEEVRNLMYSIARQMDEKGGFVQMLKDFVNTISNLLINRSVFASNEEMLTTYHNKFQSFLEGQETQNTGLLLTNKELEDLCGIENSILSSTEAFINATKEINEFLETAEYNKLVSFSKVKEKGTFENIADRLQTRISAVKASTLPLSKKQLAINNTTKLLDMYVNEHTPRYSALRATVSNVIPQLFEDLDYLRNLHENDEIMTSSDFMYQKHSNFSTYNQIFDDISKFLVDSTNVQEIIEEYNKSNKQGSNIDASDVKEIINDISNVRGAINSALILLDIQNNKLVAKQIEEQSKKSNSLEGVEYAALLLTEHKFEDVSSIWTNFGSIDSSTNEALRILSTMLNEANKEAHSATLSVATKLMQAVKNLKRGESIQDVYEKYKGKRTGYAVREVNFGHFYEEYDKYMGKLNSLITKKFGIHMDKDDRKSPDSDGTKVEINTKNGVKLLTATEAWNILRNEWLSDNCHRKYIKEYYEAWASVPQCAKDALDDINSQIQTILIQADAIDEKGYRHLDKLTDQQWKEYNKLQIERKYLYSDYDMFGNKKEENDVSYEIAKALQELNSKLYPEDDQERIKNEQAWMEARQAIIDDPSKTEDDLRNWDIRNSRLVFRKDEGHDIWKQIEDELDMAKPNYGEEHEKITKEIKDLLKPYRLQNGEILADEMTEAIKNLLKSLYKKRNEIEREVANQNAIIAAKREARKAIFEKYIEFETNDYIKQIEQEYSKQFTDEDGDFDEDSFFIAMMEFGFFNDSESSFLDLYDTFQFDSWNKHLVAKEKDKYMKYEPGDGWIDRQNDSKWLNPEFKKYEYYGSTMIPIKEKYANKQWDKIKNQYDPNTKQASGSLGELYKLTIETIKESNELQTNRIHHDNYLLPQVMASSIRRLIRARSGFFKQLFDIICEKIGFKRDQNSYIDAGVGDEIQLDAEGNYIKPKKHVGSYADGRSYNTIPQYYIKKLDDPSMISSDLVNMLISYYRMSKTYNEKSKIKDNCEAIVDRIENSIYIKNSQNGGGVEEILGKDSNSFKAARKFLDMQMYGQYTNRKTFLNGKYEASITLQTLKQYTTANNLGMNPKVAAVGFMTSMWVHIINGFTGQKYSKRHVASGFIEVIYRIARSLFGLRYINNNNTNDVLMLLMREFNAAQQGEKVGQHTNRNILVQGIIGNLTFGFMSGFDFLSKSNILVSTMKAHKFVDGEFLTFDDIERLRTKLSDEEYSNKLTRWSKGRSLYSIFKGKNYKLNVDNEEYRKAWEKQRTLIFSRVEKYAEDADGMATQLQKALMTQNFVGAFFLIHRQFLGLMLQQRWGERVYDYDTRQYKNSIFLTALKYCTELFKNSLFGSGITGALAGLALIGTGGGVLTSSAILGMVSHYIYKITHNGKKEKSISEINREFFGLENFNKQMILSMLPFGYKPKYNNPLDEKTYLNQRQNFYDIKRILCEIMLYNLLVAPTAGLAAAIADDDNDNFVLQMLAYWLRAFQWESYTPYRTTEVLGAIKSFTAATSSFEKAQNVTNSILSAIVPYFSMNLIVPSIFGGARELRNAIQNEDVNDYYSEEISRGAYSYNEFTELFYNDERGWTRREQAFFKLHPFHNLYEQLKDSKSKRHYIENQIMHIKQDNTSGNSIIALWNYYNKED